MGFNIHPEQAVATSCLTTGLLRVPGTLSNESKTSSHLLGQSYPTLGCSLQPAQGYTQLEKLASGPAHPAF